ncbi:hypothetical protein BSPWISOXPB_550 [uncultured Gammaproteobacteria bacterium]|nr:hypothetical protein BSPWISOXPB_550 [uncultured Gammaproteobacteria bacterium]
MHSTNEISTALNNTYPPLSIESKQRILNSLIKAKKYDETHTLERSYENLVTDGILADTLKPIDNALIGVQETIQATKDITNGDITNGAIVIAGAISKKIPGGKQLVDKISSIVDKKKKVRTSKVGDKVRVPSPSNIKDFVTLPRNQGYKNNTLVKFGKKVIPTIVDRLEVSGKLDWEKARFQLKVIKSQLVALGFILKINK